MLEPLTSAPPILAKARRPGLLDRAPAALVALATVWLFFAAAYAELDLPAQGHLGAGAVGNAMASESMVAHHLWYPTWAWFADKTPDAAAAYCHHPFGIYWSEALMFWLFGVRDWMVAVPAILMSTASPALLYFTLRGTFGRMSAALGTVVFTLVPIEIGMAGFHNLEVPCMFGLLLHTACAERYRVRGGRWYFVGALVGAFVTTSSSWIGYVYLAPILGGSLVLEFTFRRFRSRGTESDRAVLVWVWTTVLAVASLVMWIGMFSHLGQLMGWLSAGSSRSGGDAGTYADVLQRRIDWIYIAAQPALIALGVIAVPFLLLRVLWRRKPGELAPLGMLIGAVVWYRAFTQGGDAHVFWPHYFALYLGAAVTVLAATSRDVVFFILHTVRRTSWQPRARLAGIVIFALVPLVLVPDGVRLLAMWKDTGGRYDEKGQAFFDDEDSTFLLRSIVRPVRRKLRVALHASFGNDNWELYWAMRKKPEKFLSPVAPVEDGGLLWMRTSGLSSADFYKLEDAGQIARYGDILVADSRRTGSSTEAYSIARDPTLWESFVRGGFRPAFTMTSTPDPYRTWELRHQLGHVLPAPQGTPHTPDEERIAYNVSVVAGAPSAELERTLLGRLDPKSRTQFGTVTLLGIRHDIGPAHELELWFRPDADVEGEYASHLWAEPYAPASWSLVPMPTRARALVGVPSFPIGTWKAGHVYVIQVRLFKRLAKERIHFEFVPQGGSNKLAHPGGAICPFELQ